MTKLTSAEQNGQKLVIEKPTLLDSQIKNWFDLGASEKIEWLSLLGQEKKSLINI